MQQRVNPGKMHPNPTHPPYTYPQGQKNVKKDLPDTIKNAKIILISHST